MRYILGTLFSVRPSYDGIEKPQFHFHYRIPIEHNEPLWEGIVEISENDDRDLVCEECKDEKR